MIWLLWFLGTLYSGIGPELFLREQKTVIEHKRFFFWSCFAFVLLSVLSVSGVFDLLFPPYQIRHGLASLTFPSLMIAILVSGFLYLVLYRKLPIRLVLPLAALLIAGDLYFWDAGWHRNTLSRETETAREAANQQVVQFFREHQGDRAKLLWTHGPNFHTEANLGMILRLPIEDAIDSEALKTLNPMRMADILPLSPDLGKNMAIMGIAEHITDNGNVEQVRNALPYLKLYHQWVVASNDEAARQIYNDTRFDFRRLSYSRRPLIFQIRSALGAIRSGSNIFRRMPLRFKPEPPLLPFFLSMISILPPGRPMSMERKLLSSAHSRVFADTNSRRPSSYRIALR